MVRLIRRFKHSIDLSNQAYRYRVTILCLENVVFLDFVGQYNMDSLSKGPPDLQPAKEERDLAVFDLPVCSQRILSHLLQHTRPGAVLYQPSTLPPLS